MRKKHSKGKKGRTVKCPKCRYSFKTKQKRNKRGYVCCSKCKRYFKE